jgi:ACR3 family arsenite transporter
VSTTTVVGKLSTLDRFLPVWIGVAMVVGLLLGRSIPGLNDALAAETVKPPPCWWQSTRCSR